MDVFATRTLSYTDDDGAEKEIVLTVFIPFMTEEGLWKCTFAFDPPIYKGHIPSGGVDFIHTLVVGLQIARIFLESTAVYGRVHWQGMLDCGLPSKEEKPASLGSSALPTPEGKAANMAVLATRRLGYRDENNVEVELLLSLFVPKKMEGDVWTCGFAFGPLPDAPVRYGVGADAIEAFLDALAGARTSFEEIAPKGCEDSDELLDCDDFPYKIGRSFRHDPGPKRTGTPVTHPR